MPIAVDVPVLDVPDEPTTDRSAPGSGGQGGRVAGGRGIVAETVN
jgi:hypothetical protein